MNPTSCGRRNRWVVPAVVAIGIGLAVCPHVGAQDAWDQPPIAYSAAVPQNVISRLQSRIDAGDVQLAFEEPWGYLRSVLTALDVPVESQMLVFSKTSLQRSRIHPRTPRALYFNDDVYIGYCRSGEVLEVSAVDEELGTVFYTLDQAPQKQPQFDRQTESCLICHGGSNTRGVPGHLVRSVYTDAGGQPLLALGSHRIDHSSPLEKRWGGWYVTGYQGVEQHLGNRVFRQREEADQLASPDVLALTDVSHKIAASGYLTAQSDLVALMVMEHQATGHNLLTKAGFDVRMALHREAALNRELQESADHRWDSTNSILRSAANDLVSYFLMENEVKWEKMVAVDSPFGRHFALQGRKDSRGRSLRDLDLEHRLFRYPCSYLVDSASFAALPSELKSAFWDRLEQVLTAQSDTAEPSHKSSSAVRSPTGPKPQLTSDDRRAIVEILRETHPELPVNWGHR
jgi:hypothetical protein